MRGRGAAGWDGPRTWGVPRGGAGAPVPGTRSPSVSARERVGDSLFAGMRGWGLGFFFQFRASRAGWGAGSPVSRDGEPPPWYPGVGGGAGGSPMGWARVRGEIALTGVGRGAGSPSPHPSKQGGQWRRAPVGWGLLCRGVGWGSGPPWGELGFLCPSGSGVGHRAPKGWPGVGSHCPGVGWAARSPGRGAPRGVGRGPLAPIPVGSIGPLLSAAPSHSAGHPAAV